MSWWAVAFQALGSTLSSRSSQKEQDRVSKEQREYLQRMAEMDAANQRRIIEAQRGYELEDRAYRQDAIAGFRQHSPIQGLPVPERTNTTATPVGLPQPVAPNTDPRKPRNGLLYYT